MISFLIKNKLLSNFQFGFRPNYFTAYSSVNLNHEAAKQFNQNKTVFFFFLDLGNAFDTLDHFVLSTKLGRHGFRDLIRIG